MTSNEHDEIINSAIASCFSGEKNTRSIKARLEYWIHVFERSGFRIIRSANNKAEVRK